MVRILEPKGHFKNRWEVPSSSNPDTRYIVSMSEQGTWACGCIGWTRHFPRKDCRHILLVKSEEPADYSRMPVRDVGPVLASRIAAKTKSPPEPYFVLQTRRAICLKGAP